MQESFLRRTIKRSSRQTPSEKIRQSIPRFRKHSFDDGPVDLANSARAKYYRWVENRIYVVMGVAGSGKSMIGAELARILSVEFVEGDNFHPAPNIERMASGIPLTDDDRAGWLAALADRINEAKRMRVGLVVACSALKRSYRDVLRSAARDVQFIFLRGRRELLEQRIANRTGHYMPASLLDSQLATLEAPAPDEKVWMCDIAKTPDELVVELVMRTRT
jgi:gluconokinase